MRYHKVPQAFAKAVEEVVKTEKKGLNMVVPHQPKDFINWNPPLNVRISNLPYSTAISKSGAPYKTTEMQWFAWWY